MIDGHSLNDEGMVSELEANRIVLIELIDLVDQGRGSDSDIVRIQTRVLKGRVEGGRVSLHSVDCAVDGLRGSCNCDSLGLTNGQKI